MIYGSTPWYSLDGWVGNATDDYGVEWIVTGEDGWGSAAPARAAVTERESDDGGWDAPTYTGPRVITLDGVAVAPNKTEQNAAKDRINATAYTSRSLYQLVVTEAHLERMCLVRRSGAAKVIDRGPLAFEWSISLVAPDPRKYAVTEQSATVTMAATTAPVGRVYPHVYPRVYGDGSPSVTPGVTVFNAGNTNTGGRVTFMGPIGKPGVRLNETGAQLRFDFTMTADDVFVVDLGARTAVLNGTASRLASLIAGSAWFVLPPGTSSLRMLGTPTAESYMTVTHQSAWK